jgi:putative tryptophan/tyrosine transport system substrate-binding protein
MRRRSLVMALSVSILAREYPALGQPNKTLREIGVLMPGRSEDLAEQALLAVLKSALEALEWKEGKTIHIEYRYGEGDDGKIRTHAAELVRLAPGVIVTYGAPAITALKQATSTIPIVFAGSSDPVEAGLVESLSRPGGNITGFSHFDYAYGTKWLQFLKEVAPKIDHLIILERPADPSTAGYLKVIRPVASALGLNVTTAEVVRHEDIEPVLENAVHGNTNSGLLLLPDLVFPVYRERVTKTAARHRLPATYPNKIFVTAGGLMSYSTDRPALFRRSASYVDRILRGEKPADLPVQNPTTFALTINSRTARDLGLTVSSALLARADEVIE